MHRGRASASAWSSKADTGRSATTKSAGTQRAAAAGECIGVAATGAARHSCRGPPARNGSGNSHTPSRGPGRCFFRARGSGKWRLTARRTLTSSDRSAGLNAAVVAHLPRCCACIVCRICKPVGASLTGFSKAAPDARPVAASAPAFAAGSEGKQRPACLQMASRVHRRAETFDRLRLLSSGRDQPAASTPPREIPDAHPRKSHTRMHCQRQPSCYPCAISSHMPFI